MCEKQFAASEASEDRFEYFYNAKFLHYHAFLIEKTDHKLTSN